MKAVELAKYDQGTIPWSTAMDTYLIAVIVVSTCRFAEISQPLERVAAAYLRASSSTSYNMTLAA